MAETNLANELIERIAVTLIVAGATGAGTHALIGDWKATGAATVGVIFLLVLVRRMTRGLERFLERSREKSALIQEIIASRESEKKRLTKIEKDVLENTKARILMNKKHIATLGIIVEIVDIMRGLVHMRTIGAPDQAFKDYQKELDMWRSLLNPHGDRARGHGKRPPPVLVEIAKRGYYTDIEYDTVNGEKTRIELKPVEEKSE